MCQSLIGINNFGLSIHLASTGAKNWQHLDSSCRNLDPKEAHYQLNDDTPLNSSIIEHHDILNNAIALLYI
jgi:hypothetical protein